jgi:hypothetical protein
VNLLVDSSVFITAAHYRPYRNLLRAAANRGVLVIFHFAHQALTKIGAHVSTVVLFKRRHRRNRNIQLSFYGSRAARSQFF